MNVGFANTIFFQLIIVFLKLLNNLKATTLSHSKCSLDDSACLTAQAQTVLSTFVDGIPDLGIKNLDKINIPPMTVNYGDLTYQISDQEITGLKNTVIDKISIKMNLKVMQISFHSTVTQSSRYKLNGTLFSLPLRGEGKSEIVLNNMQSEMLLLFNIIKNEQGKDIMDMQKYYFGIDIIDKTHYYFEQFYSGDEDKTEEYNSLLNENWRVVVANYGRYFTTMLTNEIFEAIKLYMRSRPLEDLASY